VRTKLSRVVRALRISRIDGALVRVLIVGVSLVSHGNAHTQTSGCTVTTQPLSFGSYNVDALSPLTTSSKIEIRCASRITITLGIDGGNFAPSGTSSRQMRHITGSDSLTYNVFQDASMTSVWGDGLRNAGRSFTVNGALSAFAYAMIPAGQDVRFGEYRDALSIVVLP
jgi:spore coat protein U-like protein